MIEDESVGFIGLGAMGGPMTRSLLRAGFRVRAFDVLPERLEACVAAGAEAAGDARGTLEGAGFILTSLPSSDSFVQVADSVLVPGIRPGQVVIDLGTTTPPEARRIAALLAERGASLVEAPVSGGPGGAERGDLLMFVGGDEVAVERARPVLEAITRPERITYCGPSGAGQVVKGVNQLAMGLVNAAFLEAIAFGIRAGVDPAVIRQAVAPPEGYPGAWRPVFGAVADRVREGRGEEVGVKFRELPYFLREAAEGGFELPLTDLLYHCCDAGERVVVDDNRAAPSFWRQLMLAGRSETE